MRGKGLRTYLLEFQERITPAYAGKSLQPARSSQLRRDHPRLCGEKAAHSVGDQILRGSPPPMRGKVFANPVVSAAAGITPAYAGKSVGNLTDLLWIWDHPRLCGEKRENQSNNKS